MDRFKSILRKKKKKREKALDWNSPLENILALNVQQSDGAEGGSTCFWHSNKS